MSEIKPPAGILLSVKNIPFLGHSLNTFLGKSFWQTGKDGSPGINKRFFGFKRPSVSADDQNAAAKEPEYPRGPFNDQIDRLNAYWVPAILGLLVLMIEYLSRVQPEIPQNIAIPAGASGPVWCLKPPELDNEKFEYALEFCQTRNHYYVEPTDWIAWKRADQVRRQIGYYHWIAFVLVLQTIWFMLPNFVWIFVQKNAGVDFSRFIGWAQQLSTLRLNDSKRHKGIREMALWLFYIYFPYNVTNRTNHRRFFGCRIGKNRGSSIAFFYLCFKLTYVATAILQFFWMNAFIGDAKDYFWGMALLDLWAHNDVWQDSRLFPRQTFCTVPIRQMGETAYHTLQCHLRVNTYLEKIVFFIWLMLIFVAFFTLLNAIWFGIRLLFFDWFSELTVRNLLRQREFEQILASNSERAVQTVDFFIESLGCEGICLFWFIQANACPIIARDVAGHIFNQFLGGNVLSHRKGFNFEKEQKRQEALKQKEIDNKYKSTWGVKSRASADDDSDASDTSQKEFAQADPWGNKDKKKEKHCHFHAPPPPSNSNAKGGRFVLNFSSGRPSTSNNYESADKSTSGTLGSKIAGVFRAKKPEGKNGKKKA